MTEPEAEFSAKNNSAESMLIGGKCFSHGFMPLEWAWRQNLASNPRVKKTVASFSSFQICLERTSR
jgi:hypothetical protein